LALPTIEAPTILPRGLEAPHGCPLLARSSPQAPSEFGLSRGAHYTDPVSIMRIVNPVVVEPLSEEWNEIKTSIEQNLQTYAGLKESTKKAERGRRGHSRWRKRHIRDSC